MRAWRSRTRDKRAWLNAAAEICAAAAKHEMEALP